MTRRTIRSLAASVTGLLAAGLALTGCGLPGSPGEVTVKAYFADSAGLFVGNDVGVLGVTVGEITAIEPAGDQVLVTMQVDGDRPLPADVGAAVVARSVATDRYVELTPVYREGDRFEAGGTIPVDRTVTPVDFDDVLAALNEFATGIGGSKDTTKAVQRFIEAGTEALEGRGPLLNQTIHSLAEGVDGIASQREDIAATLQSLDVLLSTIVTNESTARRFVQQVSAASALLADERKNFRTALRTLDDAVTAVAGFAVDNREQIVRTVKGSTTLMETVLSKQDRLEEILRVMPLALENIALIEGDRLPVRMDPLMIVDVLGGVLGDVCERLPGDLCEILSGTQFGR